MMNSPLADLVK